MNMMNAFNYYYVMMMIWLAISFFWIIGIIRTIDRMLNDGDKNYKLKFWFLTTFAVSFFLFLTYILELILHVYIFKLNL